MYAGGSILNKYLTGNRDHWNEITPIHVNSTFYDVESFKAGQSSLKILERTEIGDVSGKTILHLQCHFGLDTLSLARLGSEVTGVDFSEAAIAEARHLSDQSGIPATFICSNLYDTPNVLAKKFDMVFTSYGVLTWLPDLRAWAQIISGYLEVGGVFYMAEIHPFTQVFYNEEDATNLQVSHSYFHDTKPEYYQPAGSYADRSAEVTRPSFQWTHSLSDIMNALISAGLTIEFLHEFPFTVYQQFPFMELDSEGWWRLGEKDNTIPLLFSMKAFKPAS